MWLLRVQGEPRAEGKAGEGSERAQGGSASGTGRGSARGALSVACSIGSMRERNAARWPAGTDGAARPAGDEDRNIAGRSAPTSTAGP